MKLVLLVLLGLAVLTAAAMVWQHLRYLNTRREVVQDRQALLHASDAFHSLTFLRVREGADAIDAVRGLKQELAGAGDVGWVYAGLVAVDALASDQLGAKSWGAVVLLQHGSRADFDRLADSDAWRKALDRFAETYTHGLQRPRGLNLLIPQMLLALRTRLMLSGGPDGYPFEPMAEGTPAPENVDRIARLVQSRELGADAIVIVNLLKQGTPEQRAADNAYGMRMAEMMAWLGYGPMHMGRAVTVEGDADFDRVALVYYPGVDYFVSMARSSYFQGIIGGKQLADTQATITVPILDRL